MKNFTVPSPRLIQSPDNQTPLIGVILYIHFFTLLSLKTLPEFVNCSGR